MNPPDPTATFLLEAEALLAEVEAIALDANPDAPDPEAINRLFRAFHTLKGSGAMFGFDAVAAFTHHIEGALDRVRTGALGLSEPLIRLVLEAKDQIERLLEAAQGGPPVAEASSERIIRGLSELKGSGSASPSPGPVSPKANLVTSVRELAADGPEQSYRIRFAPNPAILATGGSLVALLGELRSLGPCIVKACLERVPVLEEIRADQCYLAWEILLTTTKGRDEVRDVFIFVEDGSELAIEAVLESEVDSAATTREVLSVREGGSAGADGGSLKTGSVAAGGRAGIAPGRPQELPRDAGDPGTGRIKSSRFTTVHVPSEKIDRLVGLVGELVMNQSRLVEVSERLDHAELTAPVELVARLVSDLQETVLGIRMMPIGAMFTRFKRLVHDVSAELGKNVNLVTEGAETELDNSVLNQLGDPLVHLIRNSLDHGIEPVAVRRQKGKPEHGTIWLTASHHGPNVEIAIRDDGKGLDLVAIRAKAIEKSLIGADAVLSDKETYDLIFQPGFSTAVEVTNLSGRGVGMDVVRRQIEMLRGSIQIESQPGVGTTIRLILPLTLAIIDGLLVELAGDHYIIPLSAVCETVELSRAERARANGRNLITVRGELIPYLRLREMFGVDVGGPEQEKVVIVRYEGERLGLVVDRVLGGRQTVIQSLGRFYGNIDVLSGATILGDGRVALILDLGGVVRMDRQAGARERSRLVESMGIPRVVEEGVGVPA